MKEDGACLFRSVGEVFVTFYSSYKCESVLILADQVLGDEEMHDVVRRQCLDYMASYRDVKYHLNFSYFEYSEIFEY